MPGNPGLDGFESTDEQREDEICGGEKPSKVVWNRLNNNLRELGDIKVKIKADNVLQRVGEIPQYQSDSVVRRSPPLQKSKYTARTVAGMHSRQLVLLGLQDGDLVLVKQDAGSATLTAKSDNRVPVGCVRVASANALTASLGDLMGIITVEKAPLEQAVVPAAEGQSA